MNTLEDIPFQTVLGPSQGGIHQVISPEISVPDCAQILQETKYEFSLEKWILSRHQLAGVLPSCPPHWLLFSSPQDSHGLNMSAVSTRPRSFSLNSAESRLHRRTVKFLLCDSDEENYFGLNSEVYYETPCLMMERPKSATSRVKELRVGVNGPDSPQGLKSHHCRPSSAEHRPQQVSPMPPKNSKRRRRSLGSLTRKYPQNTAPMGERRLQVQRPSSAGPVVNNHKQKALNPDVYSRAFLDTAAELLSALSQEEQELLETITQRGYSLRRAIMALQKTGYRKDTEKILEYLVASERLCQLGYDEGQVEEALEMFQNCENKAAEFLQLLTQFKEMGFQQSAIKEVLLVHENHREKALEDLMTHMS